MSGGYQKALIELLDAMQQRGQATSGEVEVAQLAALAALVEVLAEIRDRLPRPLLGVPGGRARPNIE